MTDVYGVLFSGRRFCQPALIRPRCADRVDVVGQRQRHHVGLEAVDHRPRLLAGPAVRLVDRHRRRRPGAPTRAVKAALISW